MTKKNFEQEDISKIYDEIDRRIKIDIAHGDLRSEEVHEYRNAMLQGIYSVLMVSSTNWIRVRYLCECEEYARNYYGNGKEF